MLTTRNIILLLLFIVLVTLVGVFSLQNPTKDFSQVASFESKIGSAVLEAEILDASANTGISIDSTILPAGNKDLSSKSEVNAGESIQFRYVITNPSDVTYSFVILDTHIPRQFVHFIHDVTGASSLDDDQDSIIIPNIFLPPHQTQVISFKANANYFTETDVFISTEAELILPRQNDPRQALSSSQALPSSQSFRLAAGRKKGILARKASPLQLPVQAQTKLLKETE